MADARSKRVLIVNDDGIDAPGIVLLETLVRQFTDDIWVVAPDEERSGAGHSVSISLPIRVKQRDERHFAIKGTPTDCALLGIHEFLGERAPDILLSGINAGPNLAEDVTYSGTCSAAMEGAMLGVPSVALSQVLAYQQPVHWETSEQTAAADPQEVAGGGVAAGRLRQRQRPQRRAGRGDGRAPYPPGPPAARLLPPGAPRRRAVRALLLDQDQPRRGRLRAGDRPWRRSATTPSPSRRCSST